MTIIIVFTAKTEAEPSVTPVDNGSTIKVYVSNCHQTAKVDLPKDNMWM